MADLYGFDGKTAFVLGLGLTGLGTARVLRDAGVDVAAWDDGEVARAEAAAAGIALVTPAEMRWGEVGGLIKSPGIPLDNPTVRTALAAGVPLVSDFDLLWRREAGRSVRFIGITGTNGKSTVTALVGHILEQAGLPVAVGGNIGLAALALPVLPSGGFYVLECSSYQLEMTRDLRVDAGVVLNLTPDHLARHGTMEAYRDIKLGLLSHAKPDAVRVMGVDQPLMAEAAARMAAGGMEIETLSIGGEAYARVDGDGGLLVEGQKVGELARFGNLPGPHNWQNIAAAALLCRQWVGWEAIWAAVASFKGLRHRLELVRTLGDVTFVNDSKATNGDSTVPALESFPHIYWICGGEPKSDGLGATVDHLGKVRAAFTIGQAEEDFSLALAARGVPVTRCGTLDRAVAEAYAAARREGLTPAHVLLSPACASWDQFRNFEHRGDVFVALVEKLA